ncbi:phenazine biosynthesis protein phzE [Kibdelosporangium banguiense]|uniref:anthranilate synthase n=1 Tax=Kibdelosporangium banguiense TaxID=1365924 RepID=A0ABS4TLX0_9PSEU|nr:anthranilate synthase family protein [Kibdelosporangium banguiense]MBP2324999.1 phenazine biosynthesis protein phzE [Kibdelosporangium banguiense]
MTALLERILAADPPSFALLHRPDSGTRGVLDVLVGDVSTPGALADIPLRDNVSGPDVLAVVPYRQIAERGYDCVDDGTPLLAMTVTEHAQVSTVEVLAKLPDAPTPVRDGHFDVSDEEYADIVRRIVDAEIGAGVGANFVVKRSYVAQLQGCQPDGALSVFRRLLDHESGAYWTFVVHTGEHTFVGATPERHVSLLDGKAVMTPISGTYRYPAGGPDRAEVMDFLADDKETDELYMVLDEELKMMGGICDAGGRVSGPYLREMTKVAHTEYFIEGDSFRDPRDVLRQTLFSPAVTGSPLESACRVIAEYEPHGRGYYSGVLALIGRDEQGRRTLDSSILIRTADIDRAGRIAIGTGATLVRHSDPDAEVAETRAKAAGLINALDAGGRFGQDPGVLDALAARNQTVARYWLADASGEPTQVDALASRRVLVIDAEDTFTLMIGHQLRSLGLDVTVRRFDESYRFDGYDVVVLGPGPGDPRDGGHPKIAHLRQAVDTLLERGTPFLAVCLSHQALCVRLGLDLVRRDVPNQGAQRTIDLFGRQRVAGFYNTFAARSGQDKVDCPGIGGVEVCRDPHTGEVHALRGPRFSSLQFHAESILTRDGVDILADRMRELLE